MSGAGTPPALERRLTIRHVVTLVGDDGAYGGPVAVATGQLADLAGRGHDCALLSLWRGAGPPPAELDGVPLLAVPAHTLVPGQGFLGMLNHRLLLALWRESRRADVLHLHVGRDLVSLSALLAARLRGTPYVVQTHGMVAPRGGRAARLFDAALVPLLRGAAACLVLTDEEEAGLTEVLGEARPPLVRVPNGIHPAALVGGRDPDEVLFLARLHPRKRPEVFVEAAGLLADRFPQARFVLHGPDEGSLAGVRELIAARGLQSRVRYAGPLPHAAARARIGSTGVYVLPSVREPFPMSVLEALAAGTPVVTTDGCGIAEVLAEGGAALVTDGSPGQVAEAVARLLDDPVLRYRTVAAGYRAVSGPFSLASVVDRLLGLYRSAVRGG